MIIYKSIKSEEAYEKTNIELENKDKLKNEYVLRVTHDIKGHVAAILSCIEVIRSGTAGPLNDVQKEFANRTFDRTELLSNFVKNLLNLTKMRLKHDKEFEEFPIKELITKVMSPIQLLAKDKSIDLNIYIDKSIHKITGNPFTIEELYSNLLLNAIKYTPPNGHISLTVKNRLNHILTEISDSGIGIPDEELPEIFNEFYRASNVPKDIKTGSGLGLSIVKQIIENHNGKIWVSSQLGVWTKFIFILPKNPVLFPDTVLFPY
jgi:two-component system, OmpR family, phosphate regulon sensor histidine kinase PhoR